MGQRKDTTVTISVPKTERDQWRYYAEEKKMSLSAFVRRAVNVYVTMLQKVNR